MHYTTNALLGTVALAALGVAGCDAPGPEDTTPSELAIAPEGAGGIPDQYIVVLAADRSAGHGRARVEDVARELLRARGLDARNMGRSYAFALHGFAARMSRAQAQAMARDPRVAYVEQDQYARAFESWGLDRVDQRALPLDGENFAGRGDFAGQGAGVHVYIIDTGVRATHLEFAGRVGAGYDFVSDDADPDDCAGHGTHVAGTAVGRSHGLARGATVHGVRVLNCLRMGSYSDAIAGIDWVTANHQAPAVANMSLGGGFSQALDDAVSGSVAAGVVYVVAAGNDYGADACDMSPARTPDALTVGSTTSLDERSPFSDIGPCLDLFAPGSAILSAWNTSDTATNIMNGTSMAAPHVAGAAALYRANHPGASALEVNDALLAWATQGAIPDPGAGSPDKLLYVGDGSGPPEPPPGGCSNPAACVDIRVTLGFDDYPAETSWVIADAIDQVVAAGGGYAAANAQITQVVPLDPGDYALTVYDAYGDGMCCAYGQGFYQVAGPDDAVLAAGGAFLDQETSLFTVLPASELACDDGVDNDGDGYLDCADSDCAAAPICAPPPVCAPAGDACSSDAECCSDACKGKPGRRVCK